MGVFVTQVKGWVKLKAASCAGEQTQDREQKTRAAFLTLCVFLVLQPFYKLEM